MQKRIQKQESIESKREKAERVRKREKILGNSQQREKRRSSYNFVISICVHTHN